jgi:hypothetical protein
LKKIYVFLDDIAQTSKALESNKSSLDNVLTAMDYILYRFEAMKEEYKDDPIIAYMVNSGWSKMEKYYNLTDESPAYIIALCHESFHKMGLCSTAVETRMVAKG